MNYGLTLFGKALFMKYVIFENYSTSHFSPDFFVEIAAVFFLPVLANPFDLFLCGQYKAACVSVLACCFHAVDELCGVLRFRGNIYFTVLDNDTVKWQEFDFSGFP